MQIERDLLITRALHVLALCTIEPQTTLSLSAATGLHRRTIYRILTAVRRAEIPISSGPLFTLPRRWFSAWLVRHGDTSTKAARRSSRRRVALGLCVRCTRPRAPGSRGLCDYHLAYERDRRRKQRAAITAQRRSGRQSRKR